MLNYDKGKQGWQLGPRMLKWEDEQFEDGRSDEKLWKETGMDQPGSDSSISCILGLVIGCFMPRVRKRSARLGDGLAFLAGHLTAAAGIVNCWKRTVFSCGSGRKYDKIRTYQKRKIPEKLHKKFLEHSERTQEMRSDVLMVQKNRSWRKGCCRKLASPFVMELC